MNNYLNFDENLEAALYDPYIRAMYNDQNQIQTLSNEFHSNQFQPEQVYLNGREQNICIPVHRALPQNYNYLNQSILIPNNFLQTQVNSKIFLYLINSYNNHLRHHSWILKKFIFQNSTNNFIEASTIQAIPLSYYQQLLYIPQVPINIIPDYTPERVIQLNNYSPPNITIQVIQVNSTDLPNDSANVAFENVTENQNLIESAKRLISVSTQTYENELCTYDKENEKPKSPIACSNMKEIISENAQALQRPVNSVRKRSLRKVIPCKEPIISNRNPSIKAKKCSTYVKPLSQAEKDKKNQSTLAEINQEFTTKHIRTDAGHDITIKIPKYL